MISHPNDPCVNSAKETGTLIHGVLDVQTFLPQPHQLKGTEVGVDGKPTLSCKEEEGGQEREERVSSCITLLAYTYIPSSSPDHVWPFQRSAS